MQNQYDRIIMIGTDFSTRGGIASALATYRACGFFDRWPVAYVATHRDGSPMVKLLTALQGLVRFATLLLRWPRAIVHVHCASRASFWRKLVFMALAWVAGRPVILHLHGGGFARFFDTRGTLGRLLVRLAFDRAACVIVLSEAWRAWLRGVTRNPNVVCLPNPVAVTEGLSPPLAARRRRILYLGHLERAKGVYDLLGAVASLRGALPDVELILAGDGERDGVLRHAAALGISGALRLPGWVDAAQRARLMAEASVFALPSYVEGMPMSLLEAMAEGLPVVAGAVGGIPDVIDDGITGRLIAPGDIATLSRTLRRLLLDREEAERLGHAARDRVRRRFAADRVMIELGALYNRLGIRDQEAVADSREPVGFVVRGHAVTH